MEIKLHNSVVTKKYSEIKKYRMFVLGGCMYIKISTEAEGGRNINSYNLSTGTGAFVMPDVEVSPITKLYAEY